MYSLTLLKNQLAELSAQGTTVNFYSVGNSLQWQAHLESLYDYRTKKLLRDLTQEEQAFITNELTLSKMYATYWLERYAKHKTSSGRVQLLRPNLTQQVLLGIIAEMEDAKMPLLLQLLKLRQLGCSTIVQLLILHRVLFYPNTDALVASNDPDKTLKLLNQYIGLCVTNLPWWMCRGVDSGGDLIIRQSGEVYVELLEQNSAVSWQHGTQTSGMARGGNPQVAHVSELPDFKDPKELVEGSLMNAVHEDSFTLFVLESTAAGRDDWWHKFWRANEKLWGQGKSRFRPIFLPWYLGKDVWPPPGWIEDKQARGILSNYSPSALTIAHAERARAYVKSKKHLRDILGNNWSMPLEQMAFWEFSREYAIEMDSVKQWLQEVGAADADECFQSGGTQIFPYELISEYRNRLQQEVSIYVVKSENISERLSAGQRTLQSAPTVVEVQGRETNFRSSLVPVERGRYPELDPNGLLFVWEPPREGYTYSISYDAAGGRGGDNVAIEVIRHATTTERAVQVAEWAANTYTYHDAWPVLLTIAKYYSQFEPESQARIIIELAHNGNEVQDELQRRGWNKFYQRYSQGKERHFEGLGWKTTAGSRPKLTDTLIKAVKDRWFEINSPWLLREIEDLETNETIRTIRVEARAGSKDDRAIATGMHLAATHSEIAPHSTNQTLQRLMKNLQERSRSQAISPEKVIEAVKSRDENNKLIYFGTPPTIAPNEELLWGEATRSNLL